MIPERFQQLRFKHKSSGHWNRIITKEVNECLDEIERLNEKLSNKLETELHEHEFFPYDKGAYGVKVQCSICGTREIREHII